MSAEPSIWRARWLLSLPARSSAPQLGFSSSAASRASGAMRSSSSRVSDRRRPISASSSSTDASGCSTVAPVEALQCQPDAAVGGLELDLLRHHRDELLFGVAKPFDRGQLVLELAQNQRGAPAEARFGHLDVGEDVVADVEDRGAGETEVLLDLGGVAAEVGAGSRDRACAPAAAVPPLRRRSRRAAGCS